MQLRIDISASGRFLVTVSVNCQSKLDLAITSSIGSGIDPAQIFATEEKALPGGDLDMMYKCATSGIEVWFQVDIYLKIN